MPQAGAVAIPVIPTFKGFRRAVGKETDTAADSASKGFRRIFGKTGTSSGKDVGAGFKKAFESSSSGFSDRARKELETAVARSARAVSKARLTEQDAAGKARVAERQLAEAREKYARDSSKVVAAEERLEAANRKVREAQRDTIQSSEDLKVAQGKLATAAENAAGRMENAGKSGAKKFQSGFSAVFKGSFLGTTVSNLATQMVSAIGTAVGNGLRNAVDFAIGSLDVAGDLTESVNAVNVAFAQAGEGVLNLGRNSAKEFGLSQAKFNSYAVQMSAFAQSIAGEGGNVVGTLDEIVSRATDFASVMNIDVGDSLGLIQSGLAGETEPLRKYGIDLSAAAVEAYAAANGIGAAGEALTEQEKVLARYGSLMEQTAKVQGDFANTSDSFANKNRIVGASWEDMQAKIGEKFMPVAERVLGLVDEKLLPALDRMIAKFGPQFADSLGEALPALERMIDEVLPLLPGLLQSAADNLPSIISLMTAAAPAVGGAATALGDLIDGIAWGVEVLKGGINAEEFVARWQQATGPIAEWVQTIMRGFSDVQAWFRNLPVELQGFFAGVGEWLVKSGEDLIQGFIDGIRNAVPWLDDAITGALDFVSGFFPNSPAERGPFSGSGWTDLKRSGGAVFDEFAGGIEGAKRAIDLTYPTVGAPDSVTASVGGVGAGYVQNLYLDHMDPQVAVQLAGQQMAQVAARGR
jgi:hypothetical protein